MNNPELSRILLSPKYNDKGKQLEEFYKALQLAWQAGCWCTFVDELWYMDKLGLRDEIETILTGGRSKKLTMVMGMQRPVQVTRFALAESTHVISFGAEGRDCKTLAEIVNPRFAKAVSELQRFQFAWYFRPERAIYVGRLQDIVRDTP